MSNLTLYGYGESVASNMARLALSEKKIKFNYNLVYLESKGDHLRDSYKKLNPKTLIPTLLADNKPIPDSIEIMKYIDKEFPNQGESLFPPDDKEFNKLLDYLFLDDEKELGETFGTTGGGISIPVLARLLCKRSFFSVLWDYLKNHGVNKRKPIFIMVRLLGGPPPGVYKKMMSFLAKHLIYTENYLNHGKQFIYGDSYSAADCCLTALLHRVQEMRFYGVFDGKKLPNLSKYWNNISSRPSYTEAIINYETGEWKPELIGLYGEGPNDHNDLLWTEINKLIEEK
ncbi:glutathione S-transferase family protein [SAR86 cluster bacterium]|nr:glutathione S-transferase family protein [SAR86 cluster bacterium]